MTRRLPTLLVPALLALGIAAPTAGASVQTYTYRVGPIGVGPYQAVKAGDAVQTPPVTGAVVAMDANVVDDAGEVIPQSQVMLHHLVFVNSGHPGARRRDPACTSRRSYERFYGTSEELRALTLPDGYGYAFDRRDEWRASWMVMNHTHLDRRAWIRYRVTVNDAAPIRPVKPYWLSVVPCGPDPQYTVPGGKPPGATHTRRASWTAPLDGRIVAVGGHLHGGGKQLRLSQPRCANRTLVTSRPTYGTPEDPVYRVKPMLHEPDPLNISWWQSATGIPVRRGERLVIRSDYDGQFPHMRVMGIDHVYLAPDVGASAGCDPLPADARELGAGFEGRPAPPHTTLSLARMGTDGVARPVSEPAGKWVRFGRSASATESGYAFRPPKLSVPLGGRVRWRFRDADQHDVTVVSGPRGFAAPWRRAGQAYRKRFTVPGTYRLTCSLHPVYMSQVVRVRAPR